MRSASAAKVDVRNELAIVADEEGALEALRPRLTTRYRAAARDAREAPELVHPRVAQRPAVRNAMDARLARRVERDEDELDEEERGEGQVHREHDVAAVQLFRYVAVNPNTEHGLNALPNRLRLG